MGCFALRNKKKKKKMMGNTFDAQVDDNCHKFDHLHPKFSVLLQERLNDSECKR